MHKKFISALKKIPQTILIGMIAGFVSGLLGLGGGVVLVPSLVFLLRLTQHAAQGTALLVIIPTALSGTIKYFTSGNLSLEYALWIATGSMLGVLLGSLVAHQLPPAILRKCFGAFIMIVAIKMFVG